ncbi:MAG: hypothetical protein ABFD20_12030 [Anaerolineales bacterium]
MKQLYVLGARLWRLATRRRSLLILVAGCAAGGVLRAQGSLGAVGDAAVSAAERAVALWALFTAACALCTALDEACLSWHAAALRPGRGEHLASAPYPLPPRDWALYCARLVGLSDSLSQGDAPQVLLVARPRGQRWRRACLYVGLALCAGCLGRAWLADPAPSAAYLLLGQRTPLANSRLICRLDEVAVSRDAAGRAHVQAAWLSLEQQGQWRPLTLRRGLGAVAAGRYLWLGDSREAASVYVQQASGHSVPAYPIDGARPEGDRARVSFTSRQQEQLVAAPQARLLVRLVYYASGPDRGLSAELLDGASGALLAQGRVDGGTTLSTPSYRVTILPEVAVQVRTQPLAERVAWLAALLLIAGGLVAHACWPGRRAWLAVLPDGDLWLLDAAGPPWARGWRRRLAALIAIPEEAPSPPEPPSPSG